MRARRLTIAIKPSDKGHLVVPGTLYVEAGDKVTIKNAPDGAVHLFFPQPRLLGSRGRKPIVVPIVKGAAKTFTIGARVRRGTYYYAVYCDAGQKFAKGGSNPRLIFGP